MTPGRVYFSRIAMTILAFGFLGGSQYPELALPLGLFLGALMNWGDFAKRRETGEVSILDPSSFKRGSIVRWLVSAAVVYAIAVFGFGRLLGWSPNQPLSFAIGLLLLRSSSVGARAPLLG